MNSIGVNEAASWYTEEWKDMIAEVVKTSFILAVFLSGWAQYTIPLHRQEVFRGLTLYQECPVTERLCDTVLSLPMHPYLKREDVKRIAGKICDYFYIRS